MKDNQHLIQAFVLADGRKITVNDYCKSDSEFLRKLDAYYKRYSITYTDAYHNTQKKGNKALTRSGEWVEIKMSKPYCRAGKQIWNGFHRDRRQYFFSSTELAEFMYNRWKGWGATLQGRLMTVPFSIGAGKTYIEEDFNRFKYAF